MAQLQVSLNISAEEYLKLYQGAARDVFTHTADGQRIRFPANILQPFVTHAGVRGTFIISFDHNNRFTGIKAVG